ncbi:MAG: hypothetical protein RL648_1090 [Verrucomicrobiota bacterium]
MLRKIFIWWAQRRLGRTQYRFDRRHYRGVFRPGFFAHLSSTNFWQTDNDPYLKTKRLHRKLFLMLLILSAIAVLWLAVESLRALQLF